MNRLALKDRFRLSRFTLGERTSSQPVVLSHRRIFILPTSRGFGFSLLIMLLFLIALVYNNNLVYLLTFLLASVFFITILHTFRSLSGLVVREGQSKPVFAGETASFMIHIDNPTSVPRQRIQIAGQPDTGLDLLPSSQNQVAVYKVFTQRGWCEIGTVTLLSTFPLGLFRAWAPLRFNTRVMVYPKPSPIDMPFPSASVGTDSIGASQKGGDDFYGLKSYEAGESIRHIHWKAYAKGLGVFSKHYGGGSNSELWLDFDHTPGYDTEERLSQLTRWVIDADRCGRRYGLCLPGTQRKPDHGSKHLQSCLEAMALYQP